MADPGMLSLFGDDAGLFSDGLDGLADCFPQQGAPPPGQPGGNPGLGQPKLGQLYDHGPYAGHMMPQAGQGGGPPNVNAPMNGMGNRYHGSPANPHHGYPGDPGGGGGGGAAAGGGGGVWGQQQQQQQQQSRSPYQQPPAQPGGGPNQMDPAHYLGHGGMGGAQMRLPQPPAQQQQPQQGYPNMGHTPRYPHSPSRQTPHPHQHHQAMAGFPGGQYPGYQGQYGAMSQAMGPSMAQGPPMAQANNQANANPGQAMGPGQLAQRYAQGSGPAAGPQVRYPPGPPHQPMHPQGLAQAPSQASPHLGPPAQGAYPPPSSMSPMRGLGTPTPPPQQGRPPSAGLAGPPEVSGYQSAPGPMVAPLQRAPQHQQAHGMPPGQMYPGMSPHCGPQMAPGRPQHQPGELRWTVFLQKRRSSRQVKRKRYTEELEFRISDEDDSGEDSPAGQSPSSQHQQESGEELEVEEFYVKFKSFSYLHCRWADLPELEKDKRIHQKIKRFRAKQLLNNFITEMDDEPFNPDYVEVDRVLDVSESPDENGETVTLYLVKWCGLPYEDSTWELKSDIDQSKIDDYDVIAQRAPNTKHVDRPPMDGWKRCEASKDYRNSNSLREYQLEGLNWLTFNWYNNRNCILADEMGLGKTIQSITFLHEVFLTGIQGPFLVIAPLSTIPNWEREFRTWTELNAVVYHGSQASRKTIQAYEMYYRDPQGKVIKGAYRFHAVITTFEMILTDCPELRSVPWRCVVIDEAHRLKNRNCKLLEGLKMMDMEHKVLLTGTPLQNTVEELFSLLNFLEPERFPSEHTFMAEFGDLKTEEQVQNLQAILKPMMLRRLKEDVEKNLAPKEETIIEVELTNIQKKYYRAILEKNFSFLSKGGVGGGSGGGGAGPNVPNLLNTMMELRKCCNHPYLIKGAEEKIVDEFRETHVQAETPDFHLQAMVQAAGKLVLIDKLLPKLKAGGHRVLVFSQMVRCLDILEDYLIQRRYPYERIDGRVRGNLRQAAIDRFSRPDSDRFVFLLCTRAGGLGINLTAADTCIIFDSDWNPQNDLQAQARCHRIGQSKAVKIYRLITRNSYEREMFDKASLKLGLDKAVLQSMSGRDNAANGAPQLSKKEVEDLLKKGAYGALMDEEDEGSKFCEEDIDQILQRRTQTITIETEGKGSTFAKASFVSAGNRTDISLEDPDFWQKWAKKAELDLDAIHGRNTLVIDTPRVRKQTRHFSSAKEDEMLEFSELESEGEEPSRPTAKPRRPQDRAQGYPRSECFRVEKNLLVYGWGRWSDILSHGRYKRPLREADVETICRALLAYCLLHYRGDENIKSFIWDLIAPNADGTTNTLSNHSGLSTPVPRGRKGKKGKLQAPPPQTPRADWLAGCNPDHLLQEDSYKRHLKHHCNKVLLRVRMLYYLRQEVIGDQADRILEGAEISELDVWIPQPLHAEVPADWWNSEADKSLLIGVFKHGYEKYTSMRADPGLCFLERVGMPDAKAMAAEQRGADMMTDGVEGYEEDPEYKPLRMTFKDEMDEFTNSPLEEPQEADPEVGGASGQAGRLYWPAASALTARLRRLVTAYQRSNRRELQRQEALSRPDGRRRRRRDFNPDLAIPAPPRWTRREEADFYRVVSTFGVVFHPPRQGFDWAQFRAFARLDKKTDESLEKYYYSFIAMCKRVCRMSLKTHSELPDPTLIIDPITEERASRTLYRIELLRRIREQVLPHPQLTERLLLCQPSPDLPDWWECGRHDHDLLLGASRHGVSRTDYHILNDPELAFLEAHRRHAHKGGATARHAPTPDPGATPLLTPAEVASAASAAEEKPSEPIGSDQEETGKEGGEEEVEATAIEPPSSPPKEQPKTMSPQKEVLEEPEEEGRGTEGSSPPSPKSPPTERSQEEDEEKMDEDDKSEKSSQAHTSPTLWNNNTINHLSPSVTFTSPSLCPPAPSLFPLPPQDRVMINRMDNICDAILKGKWPVNRRQLFDFPGNLLPGYSAAATSATAVAPATESPLQRRSLAELSMAAAHAAYSGSEDITLSPHQEDPLSLTVPRQRRRRRRKVEIEAERAAKRRNLMDMVAQLRESHAATDTQNHAMDLTKAAASLAGFSSPSLKAQMELLQQQIPPSGHRANGSLDADLPIMRRRRGRRKNVEGLEMLFMGNKKGGAAAGGAATEGGAEGVRRRAEINGSKQYDVVKCTSRDITIYSNEDLMMSQLSKPKQKRHRCRNPNKIDINTLTGEERVPVVNRRNGRKMGGAMAPPMKELSRWLLENPEFAIAPDWTDIVKQSVSDNGSSLNKVGGPLAKWEAVICVVYAGGLNPLLLSSLLGGMDLSSLQSLQSLHLQSLQLAAGLMAFPPSSDPKQAAANAAAASMLPLMLPGMGGLGGMGGLSNMFSLGGLGGLFGGNLAAASSQSPFGAMVTGTAGNGTLEEEEEVEEEEAEREEKASGSVATPLAADPPSEAAVLNGDAAALLAGLSANSLGFNPFLLSSMAPGLFYPSVFLPPGLAALGLQGFPSASASTLAQLQSAMATASAVATATSSPTPRKEGGAAGEEQGGAAAQEGGGADSDLGGEREEEEEEEETGGEGDDSPMEEEREGEGEQEGSSEKDKSD
uniref:Chromodomain helicase DNA binding protein 7 n=1 Tax=Gadus morhua TaxID=8049 RepID=A0A8C5C3E7_GADMO